MSLLLPLPATFLATLPHTVNYTPPPMSRLSYVLIQRAELFWCMKTSTAAAAGSTFSPSSTYSNV